VESIFWEWVAKYGIDAGLWVCSKLGEIAEAFPSIPSSIVNTINDYIVLIFGHSGIVSVFLDIEYVKALAPWYIAVCFSNKTLKGMNWVLSKTPYIKDFFN
jgi:hypothetical protein